MKDETVLDLARRLPRSRHELTAVKGLGAGQSRRHGSRLLKLVQAAESLRESELPDRLKRSGRRSSGRFVEQLRELVARVAEDLGLPVEALVPRRTLEAWAAGSLEQQSWVWPREMDGWRREVLEPEVARAGLLRRRGVDPRRGRPHR